MSATYEPGNVALIRVSSDYEPEIAVRGSAYWYVAGPRLGSQHGWHEDHIEIVRPLVMIDPEDREQVKRLSHALSNHGLAFCNVGDVTKALRSLVTPPKPAEPTGLGAVVEDAKGRRWVLADPENPPSWTLANESDTTWEMYRHIDAVRVLSEGVTQ